MKEQILKIYKQLLRTSKIKFGNDKEIFKRVNNEIRNKFRLNKNESDKIKVQEAINYAIEIDNVLNNNLIQAEINKKTGTCKVKIPKDLPSDSVIEFVNKNK